MIATHNIQDISFKNENFSLKINGKSISIPLNEISSKLKAASDIERNFYQISPSGYGTHWPLIDEDLSIDALLKTAEQR
ncbi:MAG: DUF2442 domain-containing protein [Bacteroidetes bacterium]|nr:DUF2442 domain-containing protein [Bacteroidota bacterium]